MTTTLDPSATAPAPAAEPASERRFHPDQLAAPLRFVLAVIGAWAIFGVLVLLKGANPFTAVGDMVTSTLGDTQSLGDIVIRATPVILAALAVAVPARAGLINVGGEGQLLIGGVAAMGVSLVVDGRLPGAMTLVLMLVAGALGGAAWAGIAAGLRLGVGISESVSTLLLNYIALDVMYFLIYDPWKDREGSGQPATRALGVSERLSVLGDSRVHAGIVVALAAAAVIAIVLRRTSWGFRLGVVGGNPEAGRRAGLSVGVLVFSAMAVGGAMAGLGGVAQLAGAEFKLRSGFLATYGYVGFLASWLGRHRPFGVVVASLALSAIAIGGDSLQLDSKLPAASVNVLMALILLMVFGFGKRRSTT